jgi:chromate transport protein ChrA
VKPTSWRALVAAVVLAGVVGWLLFQAAYGDFVKLPTYAAVTAGLMAVFELVLARVIGQKVRGRVRGRQVHPLQVARAAALAKASSMGGALLLGLYAGFFVWLIPDADRAMDKADDAVTAAVSGAVCLLLVVAALLLERACRTPEPPED